MPEIEPLGQERINKAGRKKERRGRKEEMFFLFVCLREQGIQSQSAGFLITQVI